ncbi:hypothetical protein [Staphylococcus sp. Marseille-Q5304]|uniref:hypothetical protein n=1 Tax=Staphylococcus sp. Marseille-Q5304 TaxID=2942200 RepID=UPI0020733993|nr:hypothetical protein [Staphylococcus sp. Marseille-Q5304]
MFNKLFKRRTNELPKEKELNNPSRGLTTEEIEAYWVKSAKKLVYGTNKSVENTADRIFILLSFDDVSIDIFFQINGQLKLWTDLDNLDYKKSISQDLIDQAPTLVSRVNKVYDSANKPRIAYAQMQCVVDSRTWYLHDVRKNSIEAQLDKDPAFYKWFDDISKVIDAVPIDSKEPLPWGPFHSEI